MCVCELAYSGILSEKYFVHINNIHIFLVYNTQFRTKTQIKYFYIYFKRHVNGIYNE